MDEREQNIEETVDGQIPSSEQPKGSPSNPFARGVMQFGKGLAGGKNSDSNLQSRLNQNKNMMNRPILGGNQNNGGNEETQKSGMEKVTDGVEQAATSAAATAASAATGVPKPVVEAGLNMAKKLQPPSMLAKALIFLGVSPKIANNPFYRKILLGGVVALSFLLLIVIIVTSSGRVQDRRDAVNSYLSTGSIPEEGEEGNQTVIDNIKNEFFDTDLYAYLQEEGWCKGKIDCYNSDAANFYKTFRKKIKKTENENIATNVLNQCSDVGFSSTVKLDVPMLTATFTYNRNDDEYLSHEEDEVYADKLKIFSEEMDGLTSAMVDYAEDIVAKINVVVTYENGKQIIQKIPTTSKSVCEEYGLEWITSNFNSNGGYCIQKKDVELPSNVTIEQKAAKCAYVNEDRYKNYIVGYGEFYSTPGTYEQGGGTGSSTGSKKQSVLDFINSISSWASADMSTSGIYASVTIAQAILEGGSGQSKLASVYNNHFGMKGKGGACSTSESQSTKKDSTGNDAWDGTSVCMCGNDGCYWYRAYNNIGESLADHSRNFWVTKSYAREGVLECVQNNLGPEEQIKRIKAAGYAEDPDYVSKIMSLINTYDLTQYDTGAFNGEVPEYSSGDSSTNVAPKYYTSGGYIELYRMNLLENAADISQEKEEIYTDILKEAQETGSQFGDADNSSPNWSGNIFDPTGGNYTQWKQTNPAWANLPLGPSTIGDIGCAATSVSIQIARSGTRVTIDNFNPGTFVQAMSSIGGFDSAGRIYWQKATQIAPNFQYDKAININSYNKAQKLQTIGNLINEGCYLIMCVNGCGHWVAVTGVNNSNISIIDPGYNRNMAFPSYKVEGIQQLRCYRKLD